MTTFVLLLLGELGGEDCLVQCDNQTQENVLTDYTKYALTDDGTEIVIRYERFDSLEDVKKYDESIHLKNNSTTDNMIPSENYLTTFSQFVVLDENFQDCCRNGDFASELSHKQIGELFKEL